MAFGQMNEPPGNRLRVALTGLTMAEKFRDEGRDILLFVDNIYRYTLAGTEVSGAARPHAVRGGLPADAGRRNGPPAGAHHLDQGRLDHLDPGGVCACGRPDRPVAGDRPSSTSTPPSCCRATSRPGHLPAVDPPDSDLAPARSAGRRRGALQRPPAGAGPCSATKELRDIIAILGMDELSPGRQLAVSRARKIQRFLSQPFNVAEVKPPVPPGKIVLAGDTIRASR